MQRENERGACPSFLLSMIKKEKILEILEPKLSNTGVFLVSLEIGSGNKILVEVDKNPSISIDECVSISRQIEQNLDREEEDFELRVSSPGLDKPIRHPLQFEKNVGRKLKVVLEDKTISGKLIDFSENTLTLQWSEKMKVEGKKKKITEEITEKVNLDIIKEAKVIISFND